MGKCVVNIRGDGEMSLSCVDGNEVNGGPRYLSYYTRLKKIISPSLQLCSAIFIQIQSL